MAYFIKIVDDLNAICATGSNENFFRGENYALMSDSMAKSVGRWCQSNLAIVKLKSEGAKDDDALELYVIQIGEKEGTEELKNFVTELSGIIVAIVSATAKAINVKNAMTSKANEFFDTVEEAARLRTLLLKVAGKRHSSATSALLLNV